MAYKISEESTAVEPIVWATIGSSNVSSYARELANSKPLREAGNAQQSAEAERIRQAELAQVHKIAFEEGVTKAVEQAKNEVTGANDRLAQALREVVALKRRIRTEAESDVVKLSLAVARRILHRELNADPDSIQGIVYAGLQKLQNRQISSVRISPASLGAVRAAFEKAGLLPDVSIITDPKLRNGDIIFETALGELDASVESQLQEIERGFADRLGLPC